MDRRRAWKQTVFPLTFILVLAVCSALSCERRGDAEEAIPTVEPVRKAPKEIAVEVPQENLRLDPKLEDLDAPFAGLRTRTLGSAWDESERLIILLHGYGAEGDDLVPLAARLHEQVPAVYLLPEAPFALERGGRAWFKRDRANFELGLSYADALLKYCAQKAPNKKIVIGGFSQGAMLAANLVAALPQQVVGALIFSPAFHLKTSPASDSTRIPLFLSHGTRDTVLPFSGGVALKEKFESLGFSVAFVGFEGRHQIPLVVVEGAARFLEEVL